MDIAYISPNELPDVLYELAEVYRGAFTAQPYNETEDLVEQFMYQQVPQHAGRAGSRMCVAREEPGGPIVGFTYGYRGVPGQWWYNTISAALGPALARQWMSDYFELVELAVLPSAQGRGIGGALHDAVLRGLPHRTAMLTANPEATPALALYRGRGWQTVLARLSVTGVPVTPVVMGLVLPGGRERHDDL